MRDSEGKPPLPWKDLEDFTRQLKVQARRRRQKIEAWAEEQRKRRWLLPPRPPANAPQPPTLIQRPQKTLSKKKEASWLPEKPIHNCELDVATGIYYCPYGCGGIAKDPREAMIHEVAHFAEPEEIEGMRKEYEEKLAAQEREEDRALQPGAASWKQEFSRSREGTRIESEKHMEAEKLQQDQSPKHPKPDLHRREKIVLAIGVRLIVMAGLFPPWRSVLHGPYGITSPRNMGHAFSPPAAKDWVGRTSSAQIDLRGLCVDWSMIVIVTAAAMMLLKPRWE